VKQRVKAFDCDTRDVNGDASKASTEEVRGFGFRSSPTFRAALTVAGPPCVTRFVTRLRRVVPCSKRSPIHKRLGRRAANRYMCSCFFDI
jgi:hypothetical protein